MARVLEWVFFLYFASHIPITILFDSQALLPKELYPQALSEIKETYARGAKDALMADPPVWFQGIICVELLLQFPFFFVAAYAFFVGKCKWIRLPVIIYSTHTATTLIPILTQVFFNDFSDSPVPGPATFEERMTLATIYMPYLVIPLLMLFVMVFSDDYKPHLHIKSH
ncbi:sigma intracellular receptor 2-like isoform X2 [Branchiostoma floridae]|uniref:Sigma intracellular receptor 2 n=1 Tax=Branchiostoma floridae TaxID=7739 RepID=A0A9J7N5W2_BRAFL|nr:sigma intracellular receptor 2-like isoform X2 [Branchiostoma floridae]